MLIATVDFSHNVSNQFGTNWGKTVYRCNALLQCDHCGKSFLKTHCVKAALKRQTHHCSVLCARRAKDTKEAAKQTSLERYGVEHPMKSQVFIEHMRECWTKIYGVDHPRKAEPVKRKIQTKIIDTNQARYGVDWPLQSPVVREKAQETMNDRYGVSFMQQTPGFTNRAHYGDTHQLFHWKTGTSLFCRALYEVAVVNWLNAFHIDFDWQIRHKTPFKTERGNDSYYFVDLFIKEGIFANTWIEIKGYWHSQMSFKKWEWFNSVFPNSQVWDRKRLEELGVLINGKPNKTYTSNNI